MKNPLRFSLANLLLLTAIVAMAIALWQNHQKLAPLQEELARLRAETGQLNIVDPELIHAIRVPTEDDQPSTYRVYLPEGRGYGLYYKANGIPPSGVPEQPPETLLAAGEYLVRVKLTRRTDPKTGEPTPYAVADFDVKPSAPGVNGGQGFMVSVGQDKNDWLVNKQTGETAFSWGGPGRVQTTADPDAPLVVYRARANEVKVLRRDAQGEPASWSSTAVEGDCDGFMIWIGAVGRER
ncbi:hypothetical protein Pla175_01970 [Pirellulimonas nuda]|uniref:Uncharacterized protein n=1 Tax=Pirellulimonas nuda TaxID=2528009 RepID=A0A518D5U7_9BACT|nr:hypothetical protein [Pirellulimonas nuda]QDU86844.1 hypothetical protein Pla175_01970 [Pirellulimonas nuda]